jgi:hypothetical protein
MLVYELFSPTENENENMPKICMGASRQNLQAWPKIIIKLIIDKKTDIKFEKPSCLSEV